RAFSIDGISEWIDHAAQKTLAYVDGSDLSGSFYIGSFDNRIAGTQQYDTDVVFLQVERDRLSAGIKFHQLPCLYTIQAIDPGYSVPYRQYRSYFLQFCHRFGTRKLLFDYCGYFIRFYLNHVLQFLCLLKKLVNQFILKYVEFAPYRSIVLFIVVFQYKSTDEGRIHAGFQINVGFCRSGIDQLLSNVLQRFLAEWCS